MDKLKMVMFLSEKSEIELIPILGAVLMTGAAVVHLCGETFKWQELKDLMTALMTKHHVSMDDIIK